MGIGTGYSAGPVTHLPAQHWAGAMDSNRGGRGWTDTHRISQGEPHAFVKFLLLKYTGLMLVGAENRRHPPGVPRGDASAMQTCGQSSSQRGRQASGRGHGDRGWWPPSPVTWAPEKQSDTSWEDRAGGGGRRSLSQGKLMPPGGGEGPQSDWRWGVSASPSQGLPVGAQESPGRTRPVSRASAVPPFLEGPAHPGEAGQRRGGSRWNVCLGMFLGSPRCLGRSGHSSVSWRPCGPPAGLRPSALTAASGLKWTLAPSQGRTQPSRVRDLCF